MGAKTWMLVYASTSARDAFAANPTLDRDATRKFAARLFPGAKLKPLEDGRLSFTNPPDDELVIGCFPGVSVVAAKEFGIDYPSKLSNAFLEAGKDGMVYLHAMHSVVDWFAFGVWSRGLLQRSLSVSPDNGVMEDIGDKLPFELPFWSGEHALSEYGEDTGDYPLKFHPLDFGEAALAEFFGYQLEGDVSKSTVDPDSIPLMRFKRPAWWKFW